MAGTLYARYYDLPPSSFWAGRRDATTQRGKPTAEDFARLCVKRAEEAGGPESLARHGSWVARNGAILEQSQILTTHNFATLVHELGLVDQLRDRQNDLVRNTFTWVIRRLAQPMTDIPHWSRSRTPLTPGARQSSYSASASLQYSSHRWGCCTTKPSLPASTTNSGQRLTD